VTERVHGFMTPGTNKGAPSSRQPVGRGKNEAMGGGGPSCGSKLVQMTGGGNSVILPDGGRKKTQALLVRLVLKGGTSIRGGQGGKELGGYPPNRKSMKWQRGNTPAGLVIFGLTKEGEGKDQTRG